MQVFSNYENIFFQLKKKSLQVGEELLTELTDMAILLRSECTLV